MTDRRTGDDVASIADDPLDVDDGTGFPEQPRQPDGGPRPAGAGGMWNPGFRGGPLDDPTPSDGTDWEDRQRPSVSEET
jgi:hypothetical protein